MVIMQSEWMFYFVSSLALLNFRVKKWNGIAQWVPMEPNSQYRFRAYFKILTLVPEYLWHEINMLFR